MIINNFENFKAWEKDKNIENVLVRCDLNVPSDVEDLTRIISIRETVNSIINMGHKVILMSHYKRPSKEEFFSDKFSLAKVAGKVSEIIGVDIDFIPSNIFSLSRESFKKPITLLENLRFYEEESQNSEVFAKKLAEFADVYINEAFSVSHRAHASVCAITKFLPSFAGASFTNEIENLSKVTTEVNGNKKRRPYTAIIGGSKVSSKIDVLREISRTADYLIIAGAMANTFLKAQSHQQCNLGRSKFEEEFLGVARDIMNNSKAKIILPCDFLGAEDIHSPGVNFGITEIPENYSCFDIGGKTISQIKKIVKNSNTVLWNGALGAFEFSNFGKSSKEVAECIANETKERGIVSIIGGGETVASIGIFKNRMTFVSTAGGAFLEYVAGYELPGVTVLS